MRNYILITSILLLSSCCKATIETVTLLSNTTNEKLELRTYNSGAFTSIFIIANSTSLAPFILPYAMSPADSIQVLSNGALLQTHYAKTINKTAVGSKVFQFENSRNLLNINNYSKTVEELSCNGSKTLYGYTF